MTALTMVEAVIVFFGLIGKKQNNPIVWHSEVKLLLLQMLRDKQRPERATAISLGQHPRQLSTQGNTLG